MMNKKILKSVFGMAVFAISANAQLSPDVASAESAQQPASAVVETKSVATTTVEQSAPETQNVSTPVETAPQTETVAVQNTPEETFNEPAQLGAKVRGSAYNSVGNAIASDNVNDYLARPDLFYGQKFFYVEPAGEKGVASLGNLFFALDLSQDLGRATIGYAGKGFGLSVKASLGQFAAENDDENISGSEAGNDIGVNASYVIGEYVLTAGGEYLTWQSETNVEPSAGKSVAEKHSDIIANVGFSNAPSSVRHGFGAGASLQLRSDNQEVGGSVVDSTENSFTKITPYVNYGYKALASEHGRLLLGVNASVPIVFYEADSSKFGLILVPNVLGEVALFDNITLFGEASYEWLIFSRESGTNNDKDYDVMESHSDAVNAVAGFRYARGDWFALEFAFGDKVFTDTKSIFNGEGVFVSFGAFIYF